MTKNDKVYSSGEIAFDMNKPFDAAKYADLLGRLLDAKPIPTEGRMYWDAETDTVLPVPEKWFQKEL